MGCYRSWQVELELGSFCLQTETKLGGGDGLWRREKLELDWEFGILNQRVRMIERGSFGFRFRNN